jgi:hypothetical protein
MVSNGGILWDLNQAYHSIPTHPPLQQAHTEVMFFDGRLLAIPTLYVILKLSWTMLRRYMIKKTTVLFDLKFFHFSQRTAEQKIQGTAVIAGGR